jgi:hypothetical protein
MGELEITVTSADEPALTLKITISVVAFTVFSPELGEILPDGYELNLTRSAGRTERYFTASKSVGWSLQTEPAAGANVTLTPNGTTARISIDNGYTGKITVKADNAQSFIINVTQGAAPTAAVKVGDTFEAAGVVWRVLYRDGGEALIISESLLFQQVHSGFDFNLKYQWENSQALALLETWYETLDPAFKEMVLPTTIHTRKTYDSAEYDTLENQKIFLLSEEEVFGTINGESAADLSKNVIPNVVLFQDSVFARYALKVNDTNPATWWLRSPCVTVATGNTYEIAAVAAGALQANGAWANNYIRPALRIKLAP